MIATNCARQVEKMLQEGIGRRSIRHMRFGILQCRAAAT